MPNNLVFTTPITITDLRRGRITRFKNIDVDAAVMELEVEFRNAAQVAYPQKWSLRIANGSADAVVARAAITPPLPAPATFLDWVVPASLTGPGVATAFDQCWVALRAAGNAYSNVLGVLQGLSGDLPASLGGGTATVLPAGTVS